MTNRLRHGTGVDENTGLKSHFRQSYETFARLRSRKFESNFKFGPAGSREIIVIIIVILVVIIIIMIIIMIIVMIMMI